MACVVLALLGAAVLGAGDARADTCQASSSGSWGPIDGGSVTWSCGAGTPDAGDHFVIPAGVSVTLVDDVIQSESSLLGVTVAAGGTLRAPVTPGTGAIRIVLGAAGLDCAGTCEFVGGYRTASLSPPALASSLDFPGAAWRVGEVVPCGGDCDARPHVVRFGYVATPKLEHSLAAIVPGEDVVCFWDPTPDDAWASAEVNQCWAVVATGAAGGEAWLELDVRQGRRDVSGLPLARREIREVELALPVAPGERRVVVDATLLAGPAENGRFVGRWLRFAGASGEALGVAAKILATEDGGGTGDAILLGDLRGAPHAHAAGEPAWIDHGFAPGDAFFVMAPVRITSASPAAGDSSLRFRGALDARGVVFDDVQSVACTGCTLALREYWLLDPTNATSSALSVVSALDAIVERGCQSGGDDRAGLGRTHGLHVPGNTNLRVADVSIRHHGDDAVGMGFATTTGTLERLHVAMRTDDAVSCNCISVSGGHPHQVALRDVVCDDATDDDWNFQMGISAGGAATLEGALVWGGRGTLVSHGSPQRLEVRDLLVAGVVTEVGSPLLPDRAQGFVIRDSIQRRVSGTSDLCLSNPLTAFSLRDGIVRDVDIPTPSFCLIESRASGLMENVAFVNARGDPAGCAAGGCDVLTLREPRGLVLRDVSLVWQDGAGPVFARGLRVSGSVGVPSHLVLDGLLVHGLRGAGDAEALATVDAATIFEAPVAGPCLSANDRDGNPDFLANAPSTTLTGVEPGFRDLGAYRVDTLPGSPADGAGCGVRRGVGAPGLGRHRWMHAISKVPPERMADDADGDGVPEDPEAPRCAPGQRDGCDDACPGVFDPGQADADGDGWGDACDPACENGSDDDGDGLADFPDDPGCDASGDASERAPQLACDDGEDDDSDLAIDSADPGCASPSGAREDPACDNGLDDDGDGWIDADDATCAGAPWRGSERRRRCGMGAEVAPLLVLLAAAGRRRRTHGADAARPPTRTSPCWLRVAIAGCALAFSAEPARADPPQADFCGWSPPPAGEELLLVTDGASCSAATAVGRVPNNAAESVASLDGQHLHVVYSDQSDPARAKLVTLVDGRCEPELQVNVQPAAGTSSHDAPSVFVDGEGYVYATYNGGTNGLAGPLLRKSVQPWVPRSFGVEQSSRLFQGTEAHGFTGRDGAVYLIGHSSSVRLDVIEPNGVGGAISYRYPEGPLHVIALREPVIPGCAASTIYANFTKAYISESVTAAGQSILLAVWGWAAGEPGACPDIRHYGEDSHEVFFAYSLDGGRTWWNRAGNASRTAPNCTDPYDCSDPSDGIAMNDAAFRVTTTRQRAIRAAWYDGETDLVYLAFAKSVWCNSGVCLTQNVTSPGALMFLRFRLGAGDVFERKVADGDYHHIPAIRRGPDGRIYLYAESGGLAYEHVSDDEGATWSRAPIEMMGRVHGHAMLPCAPSTIATAGATSNGPLYVFTRTLSRADRLIFSPVADAHVLSANPASNYGGSDHLRAKTDSSTYRAYLKFNVGGVTTSVERATLRLQVTDPSPDGGSAYAVSNAYVGTSTPWTEAGLRWSNAPAIAGTPLDSAGPVSSGDWVELDVTAAVAENGTRSFAIQSASTNSVFYGARESPTPPQLVVEVASEPACSDGRDNDRDGLIDHPADPGCDSPADRGELEPGCGLGVELAPLVGVVRAMRVRRSPPRKSG